jgi:5S rRNA maturation endonuclease (ribonuclease M5)
MNKQTQSRSLNQQQLRQVGDQLCDNIEELLDFFEIDYRKTDKMFIFSCPVHGGDNKTALNIYPYGDNYRGNWKCRTHQCEHHFMSSVIGFIRGILSHRQHDWNALGDKMVSFEDTIKFIEKFLNKSIDELSTFKCEEKQKFVKNIHTITNKPTQPTFTISRATVRKSLQIPAKYYINRGYSTEILDRYDIGLCNIKGKPMYQRVVVPIYDNDYKFMIGCSGRSIFDKCANCGYFHDQGYKCPENNGWLYSKWKHSKGFRAEDTLYNYWFAKKYIEKTKTAIIVESPGNVWRLEESGIHNSVAIFGANISNKQKLLLDTSGAMNIVILTDTDIAGEKAKQQIITKFSQTYRIFCPIISKNDVADMSKEEIQSQIISYLESNKL